MPPLPLVLDMVLFAMLPAALIAAAVMALGALPRGKWAAPVAAAVAVAVAVPAGIWLKKSFAVVKEPSDGSLALKNYSIPLKESVTLASGTSAWNRLPLAALAALLAGLAARALPDGVGWPVRAAAAALAATWAVRAGAVEEDPWLPAAFVLMVLLSWALLEYRAREVPGGGVPFVLGLAAFAAGAVLIHAGIARLMEAAVILAVALMGVAVVAAWRGLDAGGAVPGGIVFLAGLLLMGRSEMDEAIKVPWTSFALAAAAPLALAVELLPPLRSWRGWKLAVVRLLLILLPLAGAVGLAMDAETLQFGDEWE